MDRQQMIGKLEQFKAGQNTTFEDNVLLHSKGGKVFCGTEEIPLDDLWRYKGAVKVMIVEGNYPDLVKRINEDIEPDIVIVESRNE
jgi:hypothetical protein